MTTVEPGGDYSHEGAVREADIALYADKSSGRDGCSFHTEARSQVPGLPEVSRLLQSTA